MMSPLLESGIGSARALTRAGSRQMWLLDAAAAALWDLHKAEADRGLVVERLASDLGVETGAAQRYLDLLHEAWRKAGLLSDPDRGASSFVDFAELPHFPDAIARPSPDGAWHIVSAQRSIVVHVESAALGSILEPLLAPLRVPAMAEDSAVDHIALGGEPPNWRLSVNGKELDAGTNRDAAIVAILSALVEVGCCTRERLFVAHAASLLAPTGHCLLLIAPGGCGKSTLTMALEASGYRLLSDDVTPVAMDGVLMGLGLPMCMKEGSWSIVAAYRSSAALSPVVDRSGQPVRYLPPAQHPITGSYPPALFLFPRFRPDEAPDLSPMTAEKALQDFIEAEAVIRVATQAQLDALCAWVSATPAYAIVYPELASAMTMIEGLLRSLPPPAVGQWMD